MNLSFNNLPALPPEIGGMKVLRCVDAECLDYSRRGLAVVYRMDCNALFFICRSELDLTNNRLEVLPREIGSCARLRVLNVSHNNLSVLPPDLSRCTQLEELRASHNLLVSFPRELCRLPALRVVDISANRLQELPLDVDQLPSLEDMDVSENPDLTMIPEEITRSGPMVQWVCAQTRSHQATLLRMQTMTDELETLVRTYDLERISLREEISRLRAEQREILAQQPEAYMQVKRNLSSVTCAIQ